MKCTVIMLVISAAMWIPISAFAVCEATESWMKSRDSGTCDFVVDPGPGYDDITFLAIRSDENVNLSEEIIFRKYTCQDTTSGWPAIDLEDCELCNVAAHGGSLLNFTLAALDIVRLAADQKTQWVYFKNQTFGDISHSGSHRDIIQSINGVTHKGGWLVIQDSVIRNMNSPEQIMNVGGWKVGTKAYGHVNSNCDDDSVGSGGMLLHNVVFGNIDTVTYGTSAKTIHGADGNHVIPAYWHIEVSLVGSAGFDIRESIAKVIVVGGTSWASTDGWPGSLRPSKTHDNIDEADCPAGGWEKVNSNQCCPNGLVNTLDQDFNTATGAGFTPVYCYETIELAVADGHTEPPMVRHSDAGWGTPPGRKTMRGGSISGGSLTMLEKLRRMLNVVGIPYAY